MKQVTLHIPDSITPFYGVGQKFAFYKKNWATDEPTKEQVLQNIKAGLQEVKSLKKEN